MDEKQVSSNIFSHFSSLEKCEYYNALFDIKFIFIDKIFDELLELNFADKDLCQNEAHIIEKSGIGRA